MTYRIKVIRLDGSIEEKEVSWNLDLTKICRFYADQKFINVTLHETKFNPQSGDLEEVVYKEIGGA